MAEQSHDRRTWMPEFAITLQIFATIAVSLRLGSRAAGKEMLGIDDLLISIAWVLNTGHTAVVLLGTERYGFGHHVYDVSPSLWPKAALSAWIIEVFFFWSTCFTKVSVLMFYRRLVSGTYSRGFKWSIWGAIAFLVIYTIVFQGAAMLTCRPLEAVWLQYDVNYKKIYQCLPDKEQTKVVVTAGALSVVTDIYAVMLPMLLLLRIRISKRQRLALLFVFGVGFSLVGAGVVRTYYLGRTQAEPFDKSWIVYYALAAAVVESNIAIICACAPSLRFLFGQFFRNLSTKDSRSGQGKTDLSNDSTLQSGTKNSQGLTESVTDFVPKGHVADNDIPLQTYEDPEWPRFQEAQHQRQLHRKRRAFLEGRNDAIDGPATTQDPEAFLFDSSDSSVENFLPIQEPAVESTLSAGFPSGSSLPLIVHNDPEAAMLPP